MNSLFHRTGKNYGWDVDLTCTKCRFSGLPRYEGWSENLQTGIGGNVTIFAKVACPQCGRRLTDEAGRKLADLFEGVGIGDQNRKILTRFIAGLFSVPFVLAFVLMFGVQMDWWGWGLGTVWVLLASALSIPLLVMMKAKRIGELSLRCACGKPHYVYMGSLDNEQCYRCYSCRQLLKVRD
jgi:hypothetical protein